MATLSKLKEWDVLMLSGVLEEDSKTKFREFDSINKKICESPRGSMLTSYSNSVGLLQFWFTDLETNDLLK